MNEVKYQIRAIFRKTGLAIYISHLDLVRTITRAVKRSKLPVWYTKGFNSRLYLNFPLALSLGIPSDYEVLDFEMMEEIPYNVILERLNQSMPDGIEFFYVGEPVCSNKLMKSAEYNVMFSSENGAETLMEVFNKFISADKIEVQKRSKAKGYVTTDIKPNIDIISTEIKDDNLVVVVKLPAGIAYNLNVSLFTDAFSSFCGDIAVKSCVKRTRILQENGEEFV